MAAKFPTAIDELLLIKGIGKKRAKQYGKEFLHVINEFLNEKPEYKRIKPNIITAQKKRKKKLGDKELSATTILSYMYYSDGLTVAETAQKREISQQRVVTHLCKAMKFGHSIDIDREVSLSKQKIGKPQIQMVGLLILQYQAQIQLLKL